MVRLGLASVSSPPALTLELPAGPEASGTRRSDSSPPDRPPPSKGVPRYLWRATARLGFLLAVDATVLLFLALLIRGGSKGWLGPWSAKWLVHLLPPHGLQVAQFVSAILLCLLVLGRYGVTGRHRDVARSIVAVCLGLGLPAWGYFGTNITIPAVFGLLLLAWMTAVCLILARRFIYSWVRRVAPAALHAVRVLLVVSPFDAARVLKHPALADRKKYVMGGIFDPEKLRPLSGARQAMRDAVLRSRADVIMLGCGPIGDEAFEVLMETAVSTGCELVALARRMRVPQAEMRMVWSDGAPLVVLTHSALRAGGLVAKRVFDLVGAGVGLTLLLPLLALVALAIRLGGPGPIIYGHTRIGAGGRPFRCLKFRSMRVDAEECLRRDPELYAKYLRNNFKLPEGEDPRITRVGRFLRKSSLDELPQLWNVIRGEMSLVGPRPVVPDELNEYGEGAPMLLSLKPGLAGAWAVNGRSHVGYPDRADIELAYVRDWQFQLDLRILARAVPAVFLCRGSH
jgi:exopolysaccharide production protein ExoY